MLNQRSKNRIRVTYVIALWIWSPFVAIAQPIFTFEPLPELAGGSSEVYGIRRFNPPPTPPYASTCVGRALDGFWKAVVWSRSDGSFPWELTVLPNPLGDTDSSALTMSEKECNKNGMDDTIDLYSAGNALDENGFEQPIFWSTDGLGTWSAEVAPVPPPFDSGGIQFMDKAQLVDLILKNRMCGWVSQSVGPEPHHAILWQRDLSGGLWSIEMLTDYGPGFASEALAIRRSEGSTILSHIGGWVQPDIGGPQAPCIWQELEGGGFERIDLPITPGAYRGAVTDLACGSAPVGLDGETAWAVGHNASIAGFADLYRGVLYRRVSGVWGAPVPLPPLPGLRDSRASGVIHGTTNSPGGLTVVGVSYIELSPGNERATLWEIELDDTITVNDFNDQTANLPSGVTLGFGNGVVSNEQFPIFTAGSFTNEDGAIAGPSSTVHAYVLTSSPVGIPAISTWGAATICIVIIVVACAILRREPCSMATSSRSSFITKRIANRKK